MKCLRILLALCLVLAIQGCDKELSGARYDSIDELQIMDYIDSREDLSVFGVLIDYVGQRNLLKTAGAYTVFIPTNDAFDRLFAQLTENGEPVKEITDASPEFWLAYFRYHLLDRKINTNEFIPGPLPYPTVYGEKYILADISESYAAIRLNNAATIREYNIELTNGYVDIIDDVLIPPTKNIYEALEASGKYGTMLGIVEEAGYGHYLRDSMITLLIESDDALERAGFSPATIENISDWVEYHIIPDSGYFLNLLTAQRFYSLYRDEPLSFQVDEHGQYVVNHTYRFNQSRDFGIDKVSQNGVYHTLDTPLNIVQAQPSTIRYNLYPPGSSYGEQNVFAPPPATVTAGPGTNSYHQNRQGGIARFDATQVGDYFWLTIPDVPIGNYRIRVIHRGAGTRGKFVTIYNDEIVKDDINMAQNDGPFEDWDYLRFNHCGEIAVEERGDVTLNFVFAGFGSNSNPNYCCDLLMDIVELIPIN